MPNPKPRNKPTFCQKNSILSKEIPIEHWSSGPPRRPEIEGWEEHPDKSMSLCIHFNPNTPRPRLDKDLGKILTWVLYQDQESTKLAAGQSLRDATERVAVVQKWKKGKVRRALQSRVCIAKKTGIPEHRVKIILRDWRAFLKTWESPAGLRMLQRMKRDYRMGKDIDRKLFSKHYRHLVFIQDGRCDP